MVGYEPNEPKMAFLSMWMGDGGGHTYRENLPFEIVDAFTTETVYSGTAKLRQKGNDPEYQIAQTSFNHNLADIHTLDFSSLDRPGTYRLVVSGIGSSFDFKIRQEIWDLTSRLLMRGFLHQRLGIELGPPYTNYQRPRNMHPQDGFLVHKCDPEKFFAVDAAGQSGVFERIRASILPDTRVAEAWGGWMDAGDFDQRMGHLFSVRRMIYLHEFNPDFFENYDLNIPESDNSIPDILDEGAWCLDLYRRTQGAYEDGGISWWVESIAHPREGESSWLNSLPTALVPPTPRAGLHYAATASQMSLAVKKYNPHLSRQYLESALAAIRWVDNHADAPDPFGSNPRPVIEALAYINLYRCTGEYTWRERFVEKIGEIFPNGLVEETHIGYGEIYTAYLLIKNLKINPELANECEAALIKLADGLLEGASHTAFDIPRMADEEMVRMVTLGRKILPIVMAHKITGDKKYADALVKTMQYTMGANPMNRTYISGLGERTFMPYQHDWEADNLHIPAGIPNFGPAIQTETKWGWRDARFIERIQDAGLYPNKLIEWPFIEKCFNNIWEAPTNEFTVRNPMGELLLLTGYLAQHSSHK